MSMNFVETFLYDIELGRDLDAYECLEYYHDWCEECGEDTDGIMFCGVCGIRQSKKCYQLYVIKTWDMHGRPAGLFELDGVSCWDYEEEATKAFEFAVSVADDNEYSAIELVDKANNETIDEWETLYEIPDSESESDSDSDSGDTTGDSDSESDDE